MDRGWWHPHLAQKGGNPTREALPGRAAEARVSSLPFVMYPFRSPSRPERALRPSFADLSLLLASLDLRVSTKPGSLLRTIGSRWISSQLDFGNRMDWTKVVSTSAGEGSGEEWDQRLERARRTSS